MLHQTTGPLNEPLLRVGIDVGGTFTDVVAVDAASRTLVARIKVPTTHRAAGGVAEGIVAGLRALLERGRIDPRRIAFIAHSTTQATNALLEGDLSRVGVVCVSRKPGPFRLLDQRAMRFPPIPLDGGSRFAPEFVDLASADGDAIDRAVDELARGGAQAVAASEAFAVDSPELETEIAERARARGFAATSGHEVSTGYGLRARTRTAALNAAILPRMLESARTTAHAATDAGVTAPLMIMRSDGGVMDVREVERRPILTLLSGPAAGVAGALFHENVTDGIFIEVGGTSADCSAIKGGMPQMRAARIGGRRTLLRTLDVRTLAIAGGSLVRTREGRVDDVGPRSAHIAGCRYASFTPLDDLVAARYGEQDGYAVLHVDRGEPVAVTPTCAANALGFVPEGAFARGDATAAKAAFVIVARATGGDPDTIARGILDVATAKLAATIEELIADYALDRATIAVVGGGGGAASLIPYAARSLGMEFRLARDAEVISPVGVALALVRDVVERTIVEPTPDDIVRVRREAIEAAIRAGASPDRVEVIVEIDRTRNRVRATASGATALVESANAAAASEDERRKAAARALRVKDTDLHVTSSAGGIQLFSAGERQTRIAAVDERAVVRAVVRDATVLQTTAQGVDAVLAPAIESATAFGDVGRALPTVYIVYGTRIAEFAGLLDAGSALALARTELEGLDPATPVALILQRSAA